MEGGDGWNWGGSGGAGGGDASLNVAAVEGVALKVPVDVLHAWQLHPVLVHAPADATFAATGRLALRCRGARDSEDAAPRPGLSALPLPYQDKHLSPGGWGPLSPTLAVLES